MNSSGHQSGHGSLRGKRNRNLSGQLPMSVPITKLDADHFLSGTHKDRHFVLQLDRWLSDRASFTVLYDKREFAAGR